MSQAIYTRKDDPQETVKITQQSRSPNGPMTYEVITPVDQAGRAVGVADQRDFFHNYVSNEKPPVSAPPRPIATDPRDEWRAWAIHLEAKLAEAESIIAHLRKYEDGTLKPLSPHDY